MRLFAIAFLIFFLMAWTTLWWDALTINKCAEAASPTFDPCEWGSSQWWLWTFGFWLAGALPLVIACVWLWRRPRRRRRR